MKNSTALKVALYGGMFYFTARAIWKRPKMHESHLPEAKPDQPLVEQDPVPVPVPVQSEEIAISKSRTSAVTPLGFLIGLFIAMAVMSIPVMYFGGSDETQSHSDLWEFKLKFEPKRLSGKVFELNDE